jgi:hypothetical protein
VNDKPETIETSQDELFLLVKPLMKAALKWADGKLDGDILFPVMERFYEEYWKFVKDRPQYAVRYKESLDE